jgi:PDZ domain-containing protein
MTPESPNIPLRRRKPRSWPYAMVGGFLATGLIVLLLWPVKLPYYAMGPGPVEDVADLITVEDVATYESKVSLYEVNAFEWFEARFLDDRVDLIDRAVIRPPGVTREQVTRTNLEAMNESIDTAVFVALEHLGYEVEFVGEGVEVLQVVEGTPAEGVIEVGDRFTEVEGIPVATADHAGQVIREFAVGDTIVLTGTRGGEALSVEITLAAHPDVEGAPLVGVVFETVNLDLDVPITLEVDSRNIGGPSAGITYALTIIDLLTEEDLTRGHVIASTGTIRFDETIGSIGGVRQKVIAARALGAEIVFVPDANYEEALSAAGDGIAIVAVSTLQDALDYLDTLQPAPVAIAAG